MRKLLFTDCSVDHQSKIGFGAYLLIEESDIPNHDKLSEIQIKEFRDTTSSKLELETLLWAFSHVKVEPNELTIITDSQNIISLPARKIHLEKSEFKNKKHNLLKNHQLYKRFYQFADQLHFELKKVKGHQQSILKNDIEKWFSKVDKASRKALKDFKSH